MAAIPVAGMTLGLGASALAGLSTPAAGAPAASSLYQVTSTGAKFTNVVTNVGARSFQQNLVASGYNIVKSTVSTSGGAVTVLKNVAGDVYTIYTRTSTAGPGAQFIPAAGGQIIKFVLGGT